MVIIRETFFLQLKKDVVILSSLSNDNDSEKEGFPAGLKLNKVQAAEICMKLAQSDADILEGGSEELQLKSVILTIANTIKNA